LDPPSGTSRYKQAALAFDDQVSHLIRPLLEFFPGEVDFDGVDLSSVIHLKNSNDEIQSVEFFFPVPMMRCFANYDCSGSNLSTLVPYSSTANARNSTYNLPKAKTDRDTLEQQRSVRGGSIGHTVPPSAS
jgi:hypothetical protein